MLDAVDRVGHRLCQRDQHRHVFGPAARHHAVDRGRPDGERAARREHHAEHLVGPARGEAQELLDLRERRRDDRQAVAPLHREEMRVDLLEAAGEHDIARTGLVGHHHGLGLEREVLDHFPRGYTCGMRADLGVALRPRMADDRRHRHVGHAKAYRSGCCLSQEPLADQRGCGKTGSFTRFTGPQHGGRA